MKSQSEIPVRRLAVFGGYGHPEPGPSWSTSAYRDAQARRGGSDATRRPADGQDANVIRFEVPAWTPDLQHAA